jgi:hypothetical protein
MSSTAAIAARFDLDDSGLPVETDGVYDITLSILAAPADTYAVTYTLHESYFDPVRESRKRKSDFATHITSYGDFTLLAELRTERRTIALSADLSTALRRGHTGELTAAVRAALAEIRDN